MEKKDGGLIEKWQLHELTFNVEQGEVLRELYPEADCDNPMMFTGTVVDEPTGRWKPGHHMRSSLIVSIDRDKGIIETLNTIYKVDLKTENQDRMPDLGNGVLGIFY